MNIGLERQITVNLRQILGEERHMGPVALSVYEP